MVSLGSWLFRRDFDEDDHTTKSAVDIRYGVGNRIRSVVRFDGTTVSNFFDSAGRISAVTLPGGNAAQGQVITNNFGYYANGALASAMNYAGAVSNVFDAVDRLAWSTGAAPQSAVSYSYYPAGQVSNVVSVAGTNIWALDAADRVSEIVAQGRTGSAVRFEFAYNPTNGMTSTISNLARGLVVSYG